MSQFLYLYRMPPSPPSSPQEREERMQRWTVWMKELQATGHLVDRGMPLGSEGGVVKDRKGTFTDGPYAETKDIVMGFSVVEAKDIAEARKLSLGCPLLDGAGLVEVRPILKL